MYVYSVKIHHTIQLWATSLSACHSKVPRSKGNLSLQEEQTEGVREIRTYEVTKVLCPRPSIVSDGKK